MSNWEFVLILLVPMHFSKKSLEQFFSGSAAIAASNTLLSELQPKEGGTATCMLFLSLHGLRERDQALSLSSLTFHFFCKQADFGPEGQSCDDQDVSCSLLRKKKDYTRGLYSRCRRD